MTVVRAAGGAPGCRGSGTGEEEPGRAQLLIYIIDMIIIYVTLIVSYPFDELTLNCLVTCLI